MPWKSVSSHASSLFPFSVLSPTQLALLARGSIISDRDPRLRPAPSQISAIAHTDVLVYKVSVCVNSIDFSFSFDVVLIEFVLLFRRCKTY